MYDNAKKEHNNGKNIYEYFVNDLPNIATGKALLPFVLSTIHHKVLEALILAIIAPLLTEVPNAMGTPIMGTDAGVYINVWYHTGLEQPGSQSSSPPPPSLRDRCQGFSPNDFTKIFYAIARYRIDAGFANQIDRNPGPESGQPPADSRRMDNKNQREKIEE